MARGVRELSEELRKGLFGVLEGEVVVAFQLLHGAGDGVGDVVAVEREELSLLLSVRQLDGLEDRGADVGEALEGHLAERAFRLRLRGVLLTTGGGEGYKQCH